MHDNNLKYELLDKLISIEDDTLLEKINDFIRDIDINKPVFKTMDEQKKMLAKSEEDIRNEDFITDDELNEEEDKWLKDLAIQ